MGQIQDGKNDTNINNIKGAKCSFQRPLVVRILECNLVGNYHITNLFLHWKLEIGSASKAHSINV